MYSIVLLLFSSGRDRPLLEARYRPRERASPGCLYAEIYGGDRRREFPDQSQSPERTGHTQPS